MGRKEKHMATAAQITANQNNAVHSTGPKTPEGKSAAARNSTKHGLSGAFLVLAHEDQDEFDILLVCLRDEFQAATEHESFLVGQMAESRWRLRRTQRLETAVFDQMLMGEISDEAPDHRIAAKLLAGGDRALATLQRYAAAAERSYYKAHAELLKSRQMRNEAKTVKDIDAVIIGRLVNAPPPRLRNEPKPGPKFYTAPGENLALRL
jgi:hypothetical protein